MNASLQMCKTVIEQLSSDATKVVVVVKSVETNTDKLLCE